VQISAWSETAVAYTRLLKIQHCRPRADHARQRLKTSASHARHIRTEPPSRVASRAASKLRRADRIFLGIFPVQPQRTARRPELVFWLVQPISDPFSTKSDRFPTILGIPDRSTVSVLPNSTRRRWYSQSKSKITTENAQTLIPKLIKDNYDSWCIRLKAFLGSQECIEIVQYGYDEPESKEVEDTLHEAEKQVLKANRKKDNKAKTIIYQGLDEAIFEIIASAETSKEIWEALQQKFKGADIIKKIPLRNPDSGSIYSILATFFYFFFIYIVIENIINRRFH